jgi:hypothetical protein
MDKPITGKDRSVVFTIADEVARVDARRPHVVIVGSGASAAAFPKGDRNGKKLPTMPNFAITLGLDSILRSNGIPPPYEDFEGIYTGLVDDPAKQHLARLVEQVIDAYFSGLELPEAPTLYDHLILSLRPKDVIATFNWDPFLCQACVRNCHYAEPPQIIFLHGNAAIGFCSECRGVRGPRDSHCNCGKPFEPCRLLYPVARKDYNSDGFISGEWEAIKRAMRHAYALTFFGYGAPKTDVEAVDLLRRGWGTPGERAFEETEIIDIKTEEELVGTWSEFIHTHHYQIATTFYDSLIARHPRRTCEHLWTRLMEARWTQKWMEFPAESTFDELYQWMKPRLEAEHNA